MDNNTLRHKIVKKTKIGHVKVYLCKHFLCDPEKVVYYTISASDGSYKRAANIDDAIVIFDQLVAFEKRQKVLSLA